MLASGQTHVHKIKFSPNKVLSGEAINSNTGNIKGLACYIIMVIQGIPVNNGAQFVSTSDCRVDFITRKVHRFKTLLDNCAKMTATNNLAVLTQATENTMNVDTATAITNASIDIML